ncbi:hypothetical protein J5N97_026062 [Dioscorea zingiberensis]|uniref:Transposase (putative) gypsy type domain-containing protein n=1 Tax=Dioscorea zingiberensis TaxID=325984 RepID=A0A9D5H660_9LILI|nr:hypothetical protein J5N97_026062 [Dioscorea zingiberensis]
MASATSSSSSSSHGPLIPSPSNPVISGAAPGEPRDVLVQGPRIHPASRAMGRGSGTFISLLGQKDVDSQVERYEIDPSLFEVRVPCSGERASSPREGEIAIYQDALSGSLRLPFSNFAKAILAEYHMCPSQLTPNSWRLLNGFVVVFKNYGVNPTVRWFQNPMEDKDLSYVKGLLASFEGEVHPPLPRGRKKKVAVSSTGADTSKEEKRKRKRKEVDSSKKGVKSDLNAGSSREKRTKRKNSENASGPGIVGEQVEVPPGEACAEEVRPALSPISESPSSSRPEDILLMEAEAGEAALLDKLRVADSILRGSTPQGKEVPSEDVPFRDVAARKNVLMAMRPEQLSSKHRGAGREEATSQLFRSVMLAAYWADRVGNLCQEDLAKMETSRADIAQLSSRVVALEEKEKEQLDAIQALSKIKSSGCNS